VKEIVNLAIGGLSVWLLVVSLMGGQYAIEESKWGASAFWAVMVFGNTANVVKSIVNILEE